MSYLACCVWPKRENESRCVYIIFGSSGDAPARSTARKKIIVAYSMRNRELKDLEPFFETPLEGGR